MLRQLAAAAKLMLRTHGALARVASLGGGIALLPSGLLMSDRVATEGTYPLHVGEWQALFGTSSIGGPSTAALVTAGVTARARALDPGGL